MFKPGRSGNPAGRPRKPRTGPDKLRQDLLRQAPEILAKLVELALVGDVPEPGDPGPLPAPAAARRPPRTHRPGQ